MLKKAQILIVFFAIISHRAVEGKDPLTTSIIIPCAPGHVKYLYNLLQLYEQQTSLPNEIVISLSEAYQIDQNILNALKNAPWPFTLKLLLSNEKLFAGQNRNIACSNATGDLLICQDADDIPYPQRIEVIKYFFDNFELDFLLHKFVYGNGTEVQEMSIIEDISSIEKTYIKTYHEAWIVGYMFFGQPALHRRVFNQIQWPNVPVGEDDAFDNAVLTTFDKCLMIHVPLSLYRTGLSVTPYELYRETFK